MAMETSSMPMPSSAAAAASQLPPGFRFHPTDEELILHYLRNRAAALPCPVPIIADVDIYKFNPWDLPCKAVYGDEEWYFFSPRDRKYPNGIRPNRAAGSGYWKATGTDKPIHDGATGETVGVKKALVFYKGRPPKGSKTDWIMHEYRLAAAADPLAAAAAFRPPVKFRNVSMRLDDWVLCRIYKKSGQAPSSPVAPPLGDYDNLTMDHDEHSGGADLDDICNSFVYAPTTSSSSGMTTTCSVSNNTHQQQQKIPYMSIPELVFDFDDYDTLPQIFEADRTNQQLAPFTMHPSLDELLPIGGGEQSAHSSESELIYSSNNYYSATTGGPGAGAAAVAKRKATMSPDECVGGGGDPPAAKRLHVSCFDDDAPQPATGGAFLPATTSSQVLGGLMNHNNMLPQF